MRVNTTQTGGLYSLGVANRPKRNEVVETRSFGPRLRPCRPSVSGPEGSSLRRVASQLTRRRATTMPFGRLMAPRKGGFSPHSLGPDRIGSTDSVGADAGRAARRGGPRAKRRSQRGGAGGKGAHPADAARFAAPPGSCEWVGLAARAGHRVSGQNNRRRRNRLDSTCSRGSGGIGG